MAIRADDVDLRRDRLLVEQFQSGDEAGFEDLYRRYYQRLYRFCLKRVGDASEAEEVTQEAFTRAYMAMPRFAGERRFYPWLSVIASRLCSDTHRRRARAEVRAEVDTGMVDGGQEKVFAEVDRDLIRRALDRLGERHREVLRLREEEGWSYQRIAEHFQVSLGATEQLLWRARRALKREFDAIAGADAGLAGIPAIAWGLRRLHGFRARIDDLALQAAPALASVAVSAAIVVGGAAALSSSNAVTPPAPVTPAPARIEFTPAPAPAAPALPAIDASATPPSGPAASPGADTPSEEPPLVGFQNERQPDPETRVDSPVVDVDANPTQAKDKVTGYVEQLVGALP